MKKIILFLAACPIFLIAGAGVAEPSADGTMRHLNGGGPTLRLSENGSSPYTIVIPDAAIASEAKAALEFQHYFLEISGCLLPIVKEGSIKAGKHIYIGNGNYVRKNSKDGALLADTHNDRILIGIRGTDLIITGTRPRGALYAVNQFLEDQLGCHWWTPDAVYVPVKKDIAVDQINLVYTSPFEYRENMQHNVFGDSAFATSLKLNGHHYNQTDSLGGHYTVLGFVHTFTSLLPVDEYFPAHHEWYVDPLTKLPFTKDHVGPVNPNDPRRPNNIQLCLSADGVVEEVSKHALAWIDKDPQAGYISISQMDLAPFCHCARCQAMFEREGSESGIVVDFVNKCTAIINKKYPGFKVVTLAYGETEKPPKTVRPAANVIVQLAPLFRNAGFPVDSDSNRLVRDNLLNWAGITKDMFIWNYTTNYRNPMMPFPTYTAIGKDIAYFARHNVRYIFEEGNDFTNGVGDFEEMRSWVTGKLLWNPEFDQDSLRAKFLQGYYGAAGPFLGQFIDLVQTSFDKHPQMLSIYSFDYTYLTLDVMNRLTALVAQASDAVKGDALLSGRVGREKLSLDLTWIFRYDSLKAEAVRTGQPFLGPADKVLATDDFTRAVAALGVTHYGEWMIYPEGIKRIVSLPEGERKASFKAFLHTRN